MKGKQGLDKFYTKNEVVDLVFENIDIDAYDCLIEPAAGDGQFLKRLPKEKSFGFDISPDCGMIIETDFLEIDLEDFSNKQEYGETDLSTFQSCLKHGKIISIGNPPFGKNASLAVRFFNKCAQFSDTIAFILPRTFRKPSVINRLDKNFFLKKEIILPLASFYTPENKADYSVPTVFQIWEKRDQPRKKVATLTKHKDFTFCSPSDKNEADFCIRRVGAGAGAVYTDFKEEKRSHKSHYYIKQKKDNTIDKFRSIGWNDKSSAKYDTAGNPSISKHDLITAYNKLGDE